VDLGDGVEQCLALGRVDRTLAAGRAGLLGGLVEQLVELRVFLEVRGLEVVGPQHPQVVLDQLGPLLLDDQRPRPIHRVLVLLVLLHDRLDRLSLDPGLRRVIDTAGQVAVGVSDGAGREKPGQPHRGNLRIAAMIPLCRPYSAGPSAGCWWSARRWCLPCGTGTHSWSAGEPGSGPATSSSPGSRAVRTCSWSSGRSGRPGTAGGWRATTRSSPTTAAPTGRGSSWPRSCSGTGRSAARSATRACLQCGGVIGVDHLLVADRDVLTEGQWARIEPLLPPVKGAMGRPCAPHRPVVEG